MKRSAMRHLATSYKGKRFATALFERVVSVWDLEEGDMVCEFDTCLDFGGRRLAISEEGSIVVTGSYNLNCISAYTIPKGLLLWKRSGLIGVQSIKFDPWKDHLFVCFDDAPSLLLDAQTGSSITALAIASQVIISQYNREIVALEKNGTVHICDSKSFNRIFSIKKETFAVLSIAFTPDCICISDSAGTIRCFDLKDQALLWRFKPPKGWHFLKIAYNEQRRLLFGVLWGFDAGGEHEIYWFQPSTGEVVGRIALPGLAVETEFALRGNFLITSDGIIYDLRGNQDPVVWKRLNFPIEEFEP